MILELVSKPSRHRESAKGPQRRKILHLCDFAGFRGFAVTSRVLKWLLLFKVLLIAYCLLLSASIATRLSAKELRDPFTFGPRAEAIIQTRFVLNGVLWDAAHPLAMIGDRNVAVGDLVNGWQVVGIKEDGVTVQRGERTEFISLGNPLPE